MAGIRLVGGAALALRYFDRGTTRDLDTLHVRPGSDVAVATAAAKVALMHDWDPGWLNFEVNGADAVPSLGRAVEWEAIHDHDGIVIEVASKEALLAMKLRANRPGRDTRDIRLLLGLCGVPTRAEARRFTKSSTQGMTSLNEPFRWSAPSWPMDRLRRRTRCRLSCCEQENA